MTDYIDSNSDEGKYQGPKMNDQMDVRGKRDKVAGKSLKE
jgi:hypothetical protein